MQIGVLTSSYPRHIGDLAGRFVAELCAELAAAGHQLEVIAPAPAVGECAGVRVSPLMVSPALLGDSGMPEQIFAQSWPRRARAWAAVPRYLTSYLWQVRRAAARWDAVISHWLLPSGIVPTLVARQLPHLAVAHSSDVQLLRRMPGVAQLVVERLSRSGARLVFTSSYLRGRLASILPPPSSRWVAVANVVRMGVRLPPAPGMPAARKKLRVLFIGRLVPVKGLHHAIDALSKTGMELVVVGDGPERDALSRRAEAQGCQRAFWGSSPSKPSGGHWPMPSCSSPPLCN